MSATPLRDDEVRRYETMNIHQISRDHQSRCPKILDIRIDDPTVIEELATRDSLEAQREYGEELLELGVRVARTHRPVSEADRVIEAYEGFERRTEIGA
jgi:hypothetical protein